MKQRQVNQNQKLIQNVQYVAQKMQAVEKMVPPQRAFTSQSGPNAQLFVGYGGPQFLKGTQMIGNMNSIQQNSPNKNKKNLGSPKKLKLTKHSNLLPQARISEEQEFLDQINRFKESIDT